MNSNTKFLDLTIVKHGLILKNGKKGQKEVLFSELDKVYLKVYKLKPVYELGFILFPFFIILLSVQYLTLEKVIFLSFSSFIPVFVKINNKSYGISICLKDGTVYRKKVSLNVKSQNISIVNAIRREQLNYYTKINTTNKLDHLEFFSKKAS